MKGKWEGEGGSRKGEVGRGKSESGKWEVGKRETEVGKRKWEGFPDPIPLEKRERTGENTKFHPVE